MTMDPLNPMDYDPGAGGTDRFGFGGPSPAAAPTAPAAPAAGGGGAADVPPAGYELIYPGYARRYDAATDSFMYVEYDPGNPIRDFNTGELVTPEAGWRRSTGPANPASDPATGGPAARQPQGAQSYGDLTAAGAVEVAPGVLNLGGILYFENVDGTFSIDRSSVDLGGGGAGGNTILDLISNAQQIGAGLGGGTPGAGAAGLDMGPGGGGGTAMAAPAGAPRNQFNFSQDPYTQQRTISTAEVATPGGGSQLLTPFHVAETLRSFNIEPTGDFQSDLEAYYNIQSQRLLQQAQNPDLTPAQIQQAIQAVNNPQQVRFRAGETWQDPGVSLGYKPAWAGYSQAESDAATLSDYYASLQPIDEQVETFGRGGSVMAGAPRRIRRFAGGGTVAAGDVWDYTQQTGDTGMMSVLDQRAYLDSLNGPQQRPPGFWDTAPAAPLSPWEQFQQQNPGLSPDWGGLRDYPEMLAGGGDLTTSEEILGVGARTGKIHFMAGEDPKRPLVNPPKPEEISIRPIKRYADGGSVSVKPVNNRPGPPDLTPARPRIPRPIRPRMPVTRYRIGNTIYSVPAGRQGQAAMMPEGAMGIGGGISTGGDSSQQRGRRAGNAIRRFMMAPKKATYRHVGTTV